MAPAMFFLMNFVYAYEGEPKWGDTLRKKCVLYNSTYSFMRVSNATDCGDIVQWYDSHNWKLVNETKGEIGVIFDTPLQYSNYTNDKYQIQFQYPSDWLIEEKTNRFEEGDDITISNNNLACGRLGISFYDDLLEAFGTTDLRSATNDLHDRLIAGYTYDYRTIESPSFLNIDSQRSGTFLVTFKQKYETDPITGAQQFWITMVGNNAYMINFISAPEVFDSPENTAIRDHFIKSIKFLGANNLTNNTVPNRFD